MFLAGMWWIWRSRNAASLGHEPISVTNTVILANRWGTLLNVCFPLAGPQVILPRTVTWHGSRENITVLNVDGSYMDGSQHAGFGGLLRSGEGEGITGFSGHLGSSDYLFAELMAI